MSVSACALGCREELGAGPVSDRLARALGGGGDGRVFVGGEADAAQLGSGMLDGRSAGSWTHHGFDNTGHGKSLTRGNFVGHNKYMTTTAAEVPVPTRGSGPVACSEADCRGHRTRCLFGRPHVWSTWYEDGRLMRTIDTFRCFDCGGVCIGDES